MKLKPILPTPKQSSILTDAIKAARRLEFEQPFKENWNRVGTLAEHFIKVLFNEPMSVSVALRKRKKMRLVMFFFSTREGFCGAL